MNSNIGALLSNLSNYSHEDKLLLEARLIGMRDLPPTIDQFIEDDYYIGLSTKGGRAIYPKWREFLRELYPDPIHTSTNVVALSGCIGSGKSYISRIILAYDYLKLTYFDTLEYASLDNDTSGKSVDLLFAHKSNQKAHEELIEPFTMMLEKSPYFSKDQFNDYHTRFLSDGPRTNIGIGKDLLSFTISECNFQDFDKVKDKVSELTSRLTSRFQKLLPYLCHVVLDSSSAPDGNFMEDYLATTPWQVTAARFSTWEIRSHMNMYFIEGSFKVYTGDSVYDPFIIPEDYVLNETQDPDKVLVCPMELINEAKSDIRRFLLEKAGITTTTTGAFISDKEKLAAAFQLDQGDKDVVVVDFYDDTDTLWDKLKGVIFRIPEEKRLYIGIDLGIVGDITGFSIAYFDDYVSVGENQLMPRIHVPLAVGISRVVGQETPIFKIIDFIKTINEHRDVSMVITDQFQSTQLRQDCKRAKINAILSSVDRTTEPYTFMKNMLYKGLLILPKSRTLQFELANLINTGKKIDHKATTSKDISDSMTNSVYNLYQNIDKAQQVTGRYSTQYQLGLLDTLGYYADDEKSQYVADVIKRMAR